MRRLIAAVITVALLALGADAADAADAAPGPDLKPVILGPASGVRFDIAVMATNVGDASTVGPITLTFATTVLAGTGSVAIRILGTGGYRVQSSTATSITFTQVFPMPPGTTSALVLVTEWTAPPESGAWMTWVHVAGGGDTNPANDAFAKRFTTGSP
jgi:hypothetical protein